MIRFIKPTIFLFILLSIVSCDTGSNNIIDTNITNNGFLELSVTDAPIDATNVKSVWIKIIEIEYQYENEWHSTGLLSEPLTVDLLTLTHGSTYDFKAISLLVGSYSNIRFNLDIIEEGTSGNSGCYIEFDNQSTSPLFVPSGQQSGYKALGSFDITKDAITGLTIDFNLRKMIVQNGNGDYLLKPVLRMVNNDNVGTITLPVDEGLGYNNIVVYAYIDGEYIALEAADPSDGEARFPNAVNSINADIDGNYILPFLPAGTYDLVIVGYNDETFIEVIRIIENIIVTASSNTTDTSTLPLSNVQYREMVSVSGGTYNQEDTSSNSFSHTVSAYQIGKYEVTYEFWYEVYQWALSHGYIFANAGKEGNDGIDGALPTSESHEPVTNINWRDAIIWCNALSEISNLNPVYYSDENLSNPLKVSTNNQSVNTTQGSEDAPYVNNESNGYRLPTEGEWQYASSYIDGSNWTSSNIASGSTEPYTNIADADPVNGRGDGKDANDQVAIYGSYWDGSTWTATGVTKTEIVGSKQSNHLGIFDMSGNVYEWCWDNFSTYSSTNKINYTGPSSGNYKIKRGGSWYDQDNYLCTGARVYENPYRTNYGQGFRLARTP